MPRGKKRSTSVLKSGRNSRSKGAKRGRKPIFTAEQKRVLNRLIRTSMKEQFRSLVKSI